MKKNYQISIKSPCDQDWSGMVPDAQGRFCLQCSKSVIDFTHYSDQELIDFFKKNTSPVCGNLRSDQLNRALVSFKKPLFNYSRLYKFITGLLLAGTTEQQALASPSSTSLRVEVVSTLTTINAGQKQIHGDSLDRVVRGKVTNFSTNEPLQATIIIKVKDVKTRISTNSEGDFQFTLPDSLFKDTISLIVIAKLYEQKEIFLENQELLFKAGFSIRLIKKLNKYNETNNKAIICVRGMVSPERLVTLPPHQQKKWWQFWKHN